MDRIMREVVDTIDVPFDRTADGTPITTQMDVLECGHRIKASKRTTHNGVFVRYKEHTRRCRKCESEQEQA